MEIPIMHYLDNSATTQVCPEAAQAALSAMTQDFGNPSSTHTVGREAKKLLDRSRASVASALGCTPAELIFTSCGSESDKLGPALRCREHEAQGASYHQFGGRA